MITDRHLFEWPRTTFEEHEWVPKVDIPRRQQQRYRGPYRAAVSPDIADVTSIPLSTDVLAVVDEASTSIARFDAELGAEIAPFGSLLLRSESVASSRIENLTASARAIALAELGDHSRRNADIIVANTRAMEAAITLAHRVDEQAVLDVHSSLLTASDPESAGRWRQQQVWVGGSNYGPHTAAFVPPHHTRVPSAMRDLVEFMRRDDLPPLVQATIAHAQFETIHPFADGNGRTGRALIHSLLRGKGLTRNVSVPVSAGLLADTQSYFDALDAYRDGRVERIVRLIADASFLAIANARQLVAELHRVRAEWADRIRVRRDAAAWKIADLLLRQPVVDSVLAQSQLGVSAPNVYSAIDHLVRIGVLQKVSGHERNRIWAAHDVLAALDAFAQRGGRRGTA